MTKADNHVKTDFTVDFAKPGDQQQPRLEPTGPRERQAPVEDPPGAPPEELGCDLPQLFAAIVTGLQRFVEHVPYYYVSI